MELEKTYLLYDANKKRYVAPKGWVTVKKYACVYTNKTEAVAVQKHIANNNIKVDIIEAGEECS